MTTPSVAEGFAEPLGVTPTDSGVNVAVWSSNATAIDFCLFDESGNREIHRLRLPARTGDVFHGHIEGVALGARYGLRADGPWRPEDGQRFNPAKLLVDPCALALDRPFHFHAALLDGRRDGGSEADNFDSAPFVPKAIVTAPIPLPPPRRDPLGLDGHVVYELHVRGFTKLNAAIPESLRGTFAGLAHPASIGHLKSLGVTMVEIMPAAAWLDERHLPPLGLSNYWGYNPIAYSAPDPRLAPGGFAEIRSAIDALHEAGIQAILDVVYNHSGESDHLGPTVSMRGLDNAGYYRLVPEDRRYYVNDAGCGNILAGDRPHIVRLVLDSLRVWAAAGFDGFRFDLATTLARRDIGFDPAAPILVAIDQDPLLRSLVMIAEPWDIGMGGYQLGAFPARWGEWNDHYRDTVRRFFKGEGGLVGDLATRVAGSADIFAGRRRRLSASVNFVTAHDGFTLADLVAYERKSNFANGESNRDGTDANHSWNNGTEGPTDDPAVSERRAADARALIAALLFSRGTPMLSMGDEVGRSQAGNNNAYAQDSALAWLDWTKADVSMLDFTQRAISLRKNHPALRDGQPLTGQPHDGLTEPDVEWFGADGRPLEGGAWWDGDRHALVAVLAARQGRGVERLCLVFKGGENLTEITLPPASHGWRMLLDSAGPAPGREGTFASIAATGRRTALLTDGHAE
ncbi:glycogen debranching enzyme GlgX [Kaistia algarum]|uniref:glycogen debranching protein GlgX n=1 Tax=Kaistia algarum TaxID=2083279 RepID=UPI000CE8E3AB|nr:glycogen debranching protein GlgX [Kaistia algarum]MCX5513176.1 glycogen debranching protein GlgX [Kaistia algarum]PPE81359.1 glycogen debranching enzyme GlgX [Kaistia algarum]